MGFESLFRNLAPRYRTITGHNRSKQPPPKEQAVDEKRSWPISRVLSGTIIHLGQLSPAASCDLPGFSADHANESLFGLAPGGVYLAGACYQTPRCALTAPFHLYCDIVETNASQQSTLCCTFRGLAPPRRYLAPCPAEPGLSSSETGLVSPAIAWLTPLARLLGLTGMR